jgi:hypothetical protein
MARDACGADCPYDYTSRRQASENRDIVAPVDPGYSADVDPETRGALEEMKDQLREVAAALERLRAELSREMEGRARATDSMLRAASGQIRADIAALRSVRR